ncbi:DUF6037 family protein [Iodobacter sp. BJB302]|uniref:DUF6037 family protein n=2 Tax=unclassified Iodobacter TaxID=235634 RepID=UPI000C0D5051|nr:DUF6037 family protein [Iodobacter sp. BJB302]PHU99610.1 rloe protein [Iodobacter sp. BJB302]
MRSQSIDRYKFEFKSGKAIFDVFFFTDGAPFILLFGVKSENFSFEIEVANGFIIDHKLEHDIYKKLCEVLGLEFNKEKPFSPCDFFTEFNSKIPEQAFPHQRAMAHDVAQYKRFVEEINKIYFFGWRDNEKRKTNVQQSNLDKTRSLLGEKAYKICKEKNISSCWTDQKEAAVAYSSPK